jgi:hypothetical protein
MQLALEIFGAALQQLNSFLSGAMHNCSMQDRVLAWWHAEAQRY